MNQWAENEHRLVLNGPFDPFDCAQGKIFAPPPLVWAWQAGRAVRSQNRGKWPYGSFLTGSCDSLLARNLDSTFRQLRPALYGLKNMKPADRKTVGAMMS